MRNALAVNNQGNLKAGCEARRKAATICAETALTAALRWYQDRPDAATYDNAGTIALVRPGVAP